MTSSQNEMITALRTPSITELKYNDAEYKRKSLQENQDSSLSTNVSNLNVYWFICHVAASNFYVQYRAQLWVVLITEATIPRPPFLKLKNKFSENVLQSASERTFWCKITLYTFFWLFLISIFWKSWPGFWKSWS